MGGILTKVGNVIFISENDIVLFGVYLVLILCQEQKASFHLIFTTTFELGNTIIPILQMRKLLVSGERKE